MSAPLFSAFDTLPTRPPTPPLELSSAVDDALAYLEDSRDLDRVLSNRQVLSKSPLRRPSELPESTSNVDDAAAGSKKVGFSLYPAHFHFETPSQTHSPDARRSRATPSSRTARPAKSILKRSVLPSLPPTPDTLESKLSHFSPDVPGSFTKMLQSTIQQLAGPEGPLRLDAYLAINGALKTYENIPDLEAMVPKMTLFRQFLARDMAWKDSDGRLDINTITQALKLTSTILNIPCLADALDDDFKTFLIDRSIVIFEQQGIPKAILKMHMSVVTQPRLYSTPLSTREAERLLSALKTIDDRCSGNSVIAARLVIYERLLEHARNAMLAGTSQWLGQIFHCMLSSIKDRRTRAIATCTQAGTVLGQEPHAGKAMHEFLSTDVDDGQTYCDFLRVRLIDMMSEKGVNLFVPQIWSAVILFFRGRRSALVQWPYFKTWLLVIQRCLNSSDLALRYQATLAWDKLVFAVMPDGATPKEVMRMLQTPISTGLERKGTDKHSLQARHYTLNSYCNLLHYSLRPGLTKEEHDAAWEAHVSRILANLVASGSKGRHMVCRVLHGLLNGNTGVWKSTAALEHAVLKPADLPRLDPRWIRSRLERIMAVLEPIVFAGMELDKEANAASDAIWYSLMQSLAEAGSQEVKPSGELKEAIAILVNVLRRVWNGCCAAHSGASRSSWLKRYLGLTEMMLTTLGPGPFAEDILAATNENHVEVARTPSHKHSKQHGPSQSPLVIILEQFRHLPLGEQQDPDTQTMIHTILKRLSSSRSTVAAKLALLDRSLQELSRPIEHTMDDISYIEMAGQIWTAFARIATTLLDSTELCLESVDSQSIGRSLRHAMNILTATLSLPGGIWLFDGIAALYDAISRAALALAGEGGVVLALVEPFAKVVASSGEYLHLLDRLQTVEHMLQQTEWPKTRQSIDDSRRLLWGPGLSTAKSAVFDPFEHLYLLVEELLIAAYLQFDPEDELNLQITASFISTTLEFLARSPVSVAGTATRKIQRGLSVWLRDESRKTGANERAIKAVSGVWTYASRLLATQPSKDSDLLRAIHPLVAASFASPHKAIVNDCILLWNETFGAEQDLSYPQELQSILRARAIEADIRLPSFPESVDNTAVADLPTFFETQTSPINTAASRFGDLPVLDKQSKSPLWSNARIIKPPNQQSKSFSSPARPVSRRSASSTPKPRLRHDDSQIQFAPIESSPLPPAEDSQLLTEHQKEVKTKQRENAPHFLDFSSSPLAQSTALANGVSKRLDFSSEARRIGDEEDAGTPSGLPETTGLLSDDIPSSPTPSSGRAPTQEPLVDEDVEMADNITNDPPSSPPQAPHSYALRARRVDDLAADNIPSSLPGAVLETGVDANEHAFESGENADQESADDLPDTNNGHFDTTEVVDFAVDLPSDSYLSNMQLQQEEEAASVHNPSAQSVQAIEESAASLEPEAHERANNATEEFDSKTGDGEGDGDVTRVENSFLAPASASSSQQTDASVDGSQSGQGSKKRKRGTSTANSSKKRKHQSPVKRFLTTYIFGQSQEENEDEEDVGDEIIVASSQRAPSEARQAVEETKMPLSELEEPISQRAESSAPTTQEEGCSQENSSTRPIKRPRGRPRKNPAPAAAQPDASGPKKLTRKTSMLGDEAASSDRESSSMVRATPTPAAAKELGAHGNELRDKKTPMLRGRKATAVVVISEKPHAQAEKPPSQASADDSQAVRTTPLAQERPVATPRSILQRLRDVLADFGEVILGEPEERQFDDVLFDLRREVHEAGRRGREQRG